MHDELTQTAELWALAVATADRSLSKRRGGGSSVAQGFCVRRFVGYPTGDLLDLDFQMITHPRSLNDDLAVSERFASGDIAGALMDQWNVPE